MRLCRNPNTTRKEIKAVLCSYSIAEPFGAFISALQTYCILMWLLIQNKMDSKIKILYKNKEFIQK